MDKRKDLEKASDEFYAAVEAAKRNAYYGVDAWRPLLSPNSDTTDPADICECEERKVEKRP